jgi:hypothetical protein
VYLKEYRYAELSDMPYEKDVINQLKVRGLWSDLKNNELNDLPKQIESLKIELYNSYFQFKRRDGIKKSIESLRTRELELLQIKDKLKHITCEGFATSCKNKYLIFSSTQDYLGKNIDFDSLKLSQNTIDLFIKEYFEQKVPDYTIRLLARTEPWSSIWIAGKNERGVFGKPSSLLSPEQRLLIVWSRVYDSIRESMDCPPDEVIEDDDCLDGWLLIQAKNRENDKHAKHGYKPGDKFNKADEIFISVDNSEDVARVEKMNSPAAIMRKQQRMKAIDKAGGKIEDHYMPDAQNKMREQLMKVKK